MSPNNEGDVYEVEIATSEVSDLEDSPQALIEKDTEPPKEPSSKKKVKKELTVEKTLWSIAKKYKSLQTSGEVPLIDESEQDRESVSEAYRELESKRHRQLDARVYQSLTKMQRDRDTKIALEGTTEKDRLRMIAWEVKIRIQPVTFISGDSTFEMDIFRLHNNDNIRILDGESADLVVEDTIIDGKGIEIKESLSLRNLTIEEKEELKKEILKRFAGKIYSKNQLEKQLDSLYADLISLMVRERRILLLKIAPDKIKIIPAGEELDKYHQEVVSSQSMVIQPLANKN
ncbi:MAG: hypothetical protein ACTSO7_06460 [Candidatus Heimdallarchaeota archaeon]